MSETSGATLTHRRILSVAAPIVISNATVPILGAVDTGVVGQLGQAAPIAAVGVGAIAITGVYWLFGFLRMGTAGLTAQASGADDPNEVAALFTRAMSIGLISGLVILLCHMPLIALALYLVPGSEEVEALARGYMQIRIFSAPAAVAIYAATGWLIGQERTAQVLIIQLWMNGLNIVLDLWFVLGLGWGVDGVAFATFLAEWSALGLALWLCRDVFRDRAWRVLSRVYNRAKLARFASLNTDILLRSAMLQAIFMSFLFLGAGFGDTTLAANQVLLQFLHITAYSMDGFAISAEAFVGKAYGAKSASRVRRAAMMTSLWGGICVVCTAAAFALVGPWIIDLMTTAPGVRGEARIYLIYMVLAPLLGCASWMLDGIFIGATRSRDMRNMMAISALIYLAALLVLLPAFGNHGLWMALLLSFVVRGITLGLRYPALERAASQ